MKIESEPLTEGLFGQVFVWMLEVLPYLSSIGAKPSWCIRTKNYGSPPDDNIFPGILRLKYEPAEPNGETVSFEDLKRSQMYPYQNDFALANKMWNSFFSFTDDVLERSEQFCRQHFKGETVLGVHYRGTDKNTDGSQTNPVTAEEFLLVLMDFLSAHPEITTIFVASDEAAFVENIARLRKIVQVPQARSGDGSPLWNHHSPEQNQNVAKDAILDCLLLSRCEYVLKNMSALSAWSKIFNPGLKAFSIAASKKPWFPVGYIPPYVGANPFVRTILERIQKDSFKPSLNAAEMDASMATTAGQPYDADETMLVTTPT
jgi:hypothetical protein